MSKALPNNIQMISWNVNGIRAALKKGFLEFINSYDPDFICLQEIRARPEQVAMEMNEYHLFWNPAQRPGYSGTAIFSRFAPLSVQYGLGILEHDREGRVLTLEFAKFFLVTVYTPNAQRDLARLDYRTEEWDKAFLDFILKLELSKPVIFCGDLNVAHKDIDLKNPTANRKNAGFTDQERKSFDNIITHGFIDTFREFHQGPGHYTWWSQRPGIREKNIGWRIDYFCASKSLQPYLKNAMILPEVMGSDHCPIALELDGRHDYF